VEKHVNSIFATLGLTAEREVNRRVVAVLALLGVIGRDWILGLVVEADDALVIA
jgi:hypothetical protein